MLQLSAEGHSFDTIALKITQQGETTRLGLLGSIG